MTATEPRATFLGDESFPIEFRDPADAREEWARDRMHMPTCMTPLSADWAEDIIGASFNRYFAVLGTQQLQRGIVLNGWAYFTHRFLVPEAERPAAEKAWAESIRAAVPGAAAYWNDEAMPALRRIYGQLAAIDVDGLDGPSLAAAWEEAWAAVLEAWVIHFISIRGPYQSMEDLADAYAEAAGKGHDAEALGLIGGARHELEEVEAGVERLAAMAASTGLEAALTAAVDAPAGDDPDDPLPPDLAAVRALPGGEDFVRELEAFLAEHGHLGQNHDDLRLASWAENPRLLLDQVLARIRTPARPVAERIAELAAVAAEREAAAAAALADRPEALARFTTAVRLAREIGYLTEGHNYWIDRMSQARLRALAIRIGRRLVRSGALDRAGDVFFLHREDIAEALRDGAPRQALVARRRAEHDRNSALTPPLYVGVIPSEEDQGPSDRFDTPREETGAADELKGVGSSAGIVRGPARVVLDQDGFGRIQPGDIIVCPSSNPSWVPVFTIAAGLITNTGGVLSHAAVVAREFGLPAVTGTRDATTRIADGRLVEIDGTAGTVRLL